MLASGHCVAKPLYKFAIEALWIRILPWAATGDHQQCCAWKPFLGPHADRDGEITLLPDSGIALCRSAIVRKQSDSGDLTADCTDAGPGCCTS